VQPLWCIYVAFLYRIQFNSKKVGQNAAIPANNSPIPDRGLYGGGIARGYYLLGYRQGYIGGAYSTPAYRE